MSVHAIEESERLRISFAREEQQLASGEWRAELAVGGSFAVAALSLALIPSGEGSVSLPLAAAYVLGIALAGHVRFDVGAGFTVPTQVLFVPMLFALPAHVVPLLCALALALGMLPDVLRGRVRASRMLLAPGNSWFALGPAIVFTTTHPELSDLRLWPLLAAVLAQLVGDFAANYTRERIRSGITVRELVEEMESVYLIDAALSPVGLAVAFATESRQWAVLLVGPLLGLLGVFSRERRARLEQMIELSDAYRGTALVLGDVVESDDAYTGEHCKDVLQLALGVADHLGLDADRRRCVEFGALLHDVGKLAVPKEIINKRGKLDAHEWEIIKTHTIEGQRLLDRVGGVMRDVGLVVRSSHERWDGGGYPDGLAGQAIPLEARIVSACDAFNAMTTTRSYRKAMPLDVAVAELRHNSGTQFDPGVVDALLAVALATPSPRAA